KKKKIFFLRLRIRFHLKKRGLKRFSGQINHSSVNGNSMIRVIIYSNYSKIINIEDCGIVIILSKRHHAVQVPTICSSGQYLTKENRKDSMKIKSKFHDI